MLLTMRYNCWQVSTHCMALDLIFLIFYFSLCVPLLPVNITKYSLLKEMTRCVLVIPLGA